MSLIFFLTPGTLAPCFLPVTATLPPEKYLMPQDVPLWQKLPSRFRYSSLFFFLYSVFQKISQNFPLEPPKVSPEEDVCVLEPPPLSSFFGFADFDTVL